MVLASSGRLCNTPLLYSNKLGKLDKKSNGLILKENKYIYTFPIISIPNIIHRLQISVLNHLHFNFVVPATNSLSTNREILGSPSDKVFLAVFRKNKTLWIITLS